jgi:hypothetical protein
MRHGLRLSADDSALMITANEDAREHGGDCPRVFD